MYELDAEADSLVPSKAVTKPRVEEPSSIASKAAPVEIAKKYEFVKESLKFLLLIIAIIGGVLTIINSSNNRADRLETTLNMRIDRLEDNLNKRIVESENRTNESIRETTRGIERLEDVLISRSEQDVSLVAPVSGAVESPLTSEIMP